MFTDELAHAEKVIIAALDEQSIPHPESMQWMPTPFKGQWGFGSNVCFQAAALEARSGKKIRVPERAQELATGIVEALGQLEGFSQILAERGYINLYIEPAAYAHRIVSTILREQDRFGYGEPKSERVMVEYSQPNTHKAFHVGHLRNVILGGAMSNILEAAGFDTIRANYLGDIGWHVIKWIWGYLTYHPDEEPVGDVTRWMQDIYAESSRAIEADPEAEAEARRMFARWEEQDPEIMALWEKTRSWSLQGFDQIYATLGEQFDVFFFESEVEDPGKVIVESLIERGLAIDERPEGGPVVVKLDELLGLDKETYRVLVVLRSDGTSLYATKEIPLAIRKFEEWNIDRSIYVIDVRQSLHLKQVFKLLELMGFEQAKECVHLSYEIVNLPGNVTMSSREGTVVFFDDLLKEALARAATIVEAKNPDLPEETREEVARSVALGALKYPMLSVDNNKVATFDWERALDFEGQASPYIQYAHVRANSILLRSGELSPATEPSHDLSEQEVSLLEKLSQFPDEVQRSAQDYKPLHIANYAYDLAKTFTDYYLHCPVLKADTDVRAFRINLTAAARQTLANALRLLGIAAPTVM